MLGNNGVYATKRRKKPEQKNVKPPPVKTNPSKRHRDRLNIELDRLTSMLPFSDEVRGRLDKLSVLRLSVGYLKVKSYFHAALQKNTRSAPLVPSNGSRNGQSVSLDGVSFSEGDLLLQALHGLVLVVTTDGTIFYTSSTIQDFLGFQQSDVVHQSVYNLIHMDDREMFKCQLHFAFNPSETDSNMRAQDTQSGIRALSSPESFLPQYIPPENSSFLERSFCCRLRCLLDNTSGFMALNFNGRLKYLHLPENAGAGGTLAPPQLALFAIATPVQPPSVMEIRTKTLIFQTKHRMDFAPIGVDTRGKLVLGYSEIELVTTGSGYQFLHAADMMYCADNHLRMMKTGDSGFTFFRLLTKTGHWLWVQASARIIFKGGRPDFIIARQKALTNEEGEEHLRQRRQQLPFNLTTGEGVLYDFSMDTFSIPGPGSPDTTESATEKPLDPTSILGSLRQQDQSLYTKPQTSSPPLPVFTQTDDADFEDQPLEQAFLDSHALLSVPGQLQASQNRSSMGDLTSQAMIDSLEQILGDIGDGMLEDLEVEEEELRDWENTLFRMNKDRGDESRELNQILANDVFSYVEEALRRETGGPHDADAQIQTQHPASVLSNHEHQWQNMTDRKSNQSGFAQQTHSAGLKGVSEVASRGAATTQCRNTQQGLTSTVWPPNSSSTQHCGTQMTSTQLCCSFHSQPEVTDQPWPPFTQNSRYQSVQYMQNGSGSQQTYVESSGVAMWQQQQLPQSFHHHTLTHSSHTPGSVNSAAQTFQQTQRLSSSCMYKKRDVHIPNSATVPPRLNSPLLGPASSGSSAHVAGTNMNSPFIGGIWPAAPNPGVIQSSGPDAHMAICADVGNISLGHLSGDNSNYPNPNPENGSLQSSFFCWSGEAQIPKVAMNGIVDLFAFPALPAGSINLSQNAGP
ncbi:aryl hydrocarbon receptor-like isoform X1 [Scomber scombrus]|uniref:aryl hydrocarbon receptor-like isoform X1 n=2 Tax=Scomber scombrus TaxID=13677 RepID=UPI002DD9BD72|nr:aryl hydrocarbon receptor-like isoform X1 [Scomber scombrus]